MPPLSSTEEITTFQAFQNAWFEHETNANRLFERIKGLSSISKDELTELEHEVQQTEGAIADITGQLNTIQSAFLSEIERRCNRYKNLIEKLRRYVESVNSEKYLLEYKQRDLLQLTSELEEAYQEISDKNKELLEQKQLIIDQTEELKAAQEKIIEANEALEQQKEALLDQTDYLHEANRVVIQMHEEVQQQKEEITKKNDELLLLNQEKNNLIGIVAHDLKSPLNQLKGLMSLMKMTSEGELPAEAQNCLQMMESSVDHMRGMITKILDVEAMEASTMNLNVESVNFSDLVKQVVSRFETEASHKTIQLHSKIDESILANVDRSYTDQVLQNLLSNAIKFSPSGKNIFISLTAKESKLRFEVKDEGPGLTEDDKKKLFGKYQKLSAKPTANESSTGLGLSIVKKFVEAMHGSIGCESEYGRGACFYVEFNQA